MHHVEFVNGNVPCGSIQCAEKLVKKDSYMQLRSCVGDVNYFDGCDLWFYIQLIASVHKLWHTIPLYGFSPNPGPASRKANIQSVELVRSGTTRVYVYS